MKKLFVFSTLFFVTLNLQSSEIFIFDTLQTIPNSCIHYSVPNRYVCKDNFTQVEFHDLKYVREVFSEYKNKATYTSKEIDGLVHFYAQEHTGNNKLKLYSLCKNTDCILIASTNNTAITEWLKPLAKKLLINR